MHVARVKAITKSYTVNTTAKLGPKFMLRFPERYDLRNDFSMQCSAPLYVSPGNLTSTMPL